MPNCAASVKHPCRRAKSGVNFKEFFQSLESDESLKMRLNAILSIEYAPPNGSIPSQTLEKDEGKVRKTPTSRMLQND